MTMTWKKFKEIEVKLPKEELDQFTKGFSDATGGLAELIVKEYSNIERLFKYGHKTIGYKVILISQFIDNYTFEVLSITHDITLYPLMLMLDEDIAKELGMTNNVSKIDTKSELLELLPRIFDSKKFNVTVGGIMKVANYYKNNIKK